MAIARPVTKTIISTTAWGIPITDEVNRLSPLVDRVQATAWTTLPLTNGWVSYDANRPAQVRKVGDICYLRGVIRTGTWGPFATIPAGYRPVTGKDGSWATNASGAVVLITLDPATNILQLMGTGLNSYVYLEPVFWQWNGST